MADERDILLHEIAHIVVSEYYKIPVQQLHFDTDNDIYKTDTDGKWLKDVQEKIDAGESLKKHKQSVRKAAHLLLAGEVFNCTYDYGELDTQDLLYIQTTPEGEKAQNISSTLFTFSKLASETLTILKKQSVRINSLYEILHHETAKSKIVNIPPPEPPTTIVQSLRSKMNKWLRLPFH